MNFGTDETADRTKNVKINEVSAILIAAGLLARRFHSFAVHHSNCDGPWKVQLVVTGCGDGSGPQELSFDWLA